MSTNDPLGIGTLQRAVDTLTGQLEEIRKAIDIATELPITEKMLMEQTGIRPHALLSLRQEGRIRYHKPGKAVMYFPSEFAEDIRRL